MSNKGVRVQVILNHEQADFLKSRMSNLSEAMKNAIREQYPDFPPNTPRGAQLGSKNAKKR
jgi:hypothetical protein